jgi:hypothetical protein
VWTFDGQDRRVDRWGIHGAEQTANHWVSQERPPGTWGEHGLSTMTTFCDG